MKTLLWLDDVRDPLGYCPGESKWAWTFSPIQQPFNTVWVKSYKEFENWIYENGLPDAICFDHDLGEPIGDDEKTGMDCAKFVVEYCIEYKLKLPLYNIQSANPAGKENIDSLLKNFLKQHA